MAAVIEIGDLDEIGSKEDTVTDNASVNGVCNYKEDEEEDSQGSQHVQKSLVSKSVENDKGNVDVNVEDSEDEGSGIEEDLDKSDGEEDDEEQEEEEEEDEDEEKTESDGIDKGEESSTNYEIHEVTEDGEVSEQDISDQEENGMRNGSSSTDEGSGSDSDDGSNSKADADNDVVIGDQKDTEVVVIDDKEPVENGSPLSNLKNKSSGGIQIINLDSPIKKKKQTDSLDSPIRRSSRNLHKGRRTYLDEGLVIKSVKSGTSTKKGTQNVSDESDIEEITPEDPLAVGDNDKGDGKKLIASNSTIVVKDTKRLVEIASKSAPSNNNKKEPTLVIIDTNSILSGRGPVPISPKSSSSSLSNSYSSLPMALPAQGVYPANMRATITPIPMSQSSKSSQQSSQSAPVLPTLTDDMFVVEAPSFIVPYVYEKPPLKDMKEFVDVIRKEVLAQEKKDEEDGGSEKGDGEKDTDNEKENENDKPELDITLMTDTRKSSSYFDSPLGKFFIGIGFGLVQEAVQTDLLRQQKRKRDREGGKNSETKKTINTIVKNLEYTKETNESFRMLIKKCEFCNYRTESALAMAFHLETPHMKNYVYRCNFCQYEVRSPHDILFHMEMQHGVRGRLERAPAFHQCPSCPFEDNQKGKLSRHLVACSRKFRPDRNLEPPIDWEPPAKIPRAPRMRSQNLNSAMAAYQSLTKSSQYPMLPKGTISAMQRGRGRPLGSAFKQSSNNRSSGLMYKQGSISGGSVLVPTNYQLSGNQLFQVVGGQETGGRLGSGGTSTYLPHMSTVPNSVPIQQNISKMKSSQQPSISITPLPRGSSTPSVPAAKPGDSNSKNSFVICEICDGYIKDLEQLRNHMQWIHKVKIHPKMIYNRPPLNCQKCQFRFFTDQGLERHLLGSHGLVTSSMQEAANKSKDAGRCPVCGRVYQWKLLNHVARDHNMTLKPAHLSYKCTVCTATFGMYKQFESHVYSAHSVVAKRSVDKKTVSSSSSSSNKNDSILKPLKINDEITIIPQPAKSSNGSHLSKDDAASTSGEALRITSSVPSTSKSKRK